MFFNSDDLMKSINQVKEILAAKWGGATGQERKFMSCSYCQELC